MILLATLAILLLSCGAKKEEPEAKPVVVVTVKTAVARSSIVDRILESPATIFPREQANITPRMTGVIRELKARKGDTVVTGAPLALLENRDLVSQREEAVAMQSDAQASLEKVRNGTLPTEIERARGQLETSRALLNQAQTIYSRRKTLFEQGVIPNRDLLVSETELSTARTNAEVARKSLQLLEQQSGGLDIKIAESRVEQARSRLATITAQLQFAEIRAPFKGVITEQFQYAGDLGQPTAPIFTLVDLSVISARAQVPEADASQLNKGQSCAFNSVNGRVTVINRAVDQQRRTVEVWCEIARPPQTLRSGTFGSVAFQTGRTRDMVLVPISALQLQEGTNKGIVMVVDGKKIAHKREVEVGEVIADSRVILSGLKAGETVIIEGGYELPDGVQVQVGTQK